MTEPIQAIRVWTGDTKIGIPRWTLIGHRANRVFQGSTLSPWIASLWKQAAVNRDSLTVTWQRSEDERYIHVTHVELIAAEGVSA